MGGADRLLVCAGLLSAPFRVLDSSCSGYLRGMMIVFIVLLKWRSRAWTSQSREAKQTRDRATKAFDCLLGVGTLVQPNLAQNHFLGRRTEGSVCSI
jgi:hypothetical protein